MKLKKINRLLDICMGTLSFIANMSLSEPNAICVAKDMQEAIKMLESASCNKAEKKTKKELYHRAELYRIAECYPYPLSTVESIYDRVKDYNAVETIFKHSAQLCCEPSYIVDIIFGFNESYK